MRGGPMHELLRSLRADHRRMRALVASCESACGAERMERLVELARVTRRHDAVEQTTVHAALLALAEGRAAARSALRGQLALHRQMTELCAGLRERTGYARELARYAAALDAQTRFEEEVLFVQAERLLDPARLARLGAARSREARRRLPTLP